LKDELIHIEKQEDSDNNSSIHDNIQYHVKNASSPSLKKRVVGRLDIKKKSPLMIVFFIVVWIASLLVYGPGLFKILAFGDNIMQIVLLLTFAIMLTIFWMLAAYFFAVVVFSFFSIPVSIPDAISQNGHAIIAILYPTCNDFKEEAALSCLNQNYPNFHLFLLDDSYNKECKEKVDEFNKKHPEKTTIIRRPDRKSYKAGNLNHALTTKVVDYPFFVVVDADEVLPSNFLQRTIMYMDDPEIGFVQANHAPNQNQTSKFAKDISPTILPFWDIHCKTRNKFGFVTFVGHGALIRRSAWERVNGFPEVITEDLAFSIELRKKGYFGIFVEDLMCFEDFPENYIAFKKQQERYIIGTTQVILKNIKSVIQSKKISLIEKIDIFMWCSPLYISPLVLLFLLLNSIAITLVFGFWDMSTISIFGNEYYLNLVRIFDSPYKLLYSLDFQIFSVFCAFSPAFASIALGFERKVNTPKLLFLCTVPYLSLMVITWRGILGYLFKGRVIFPPTGEQMVISNKDKLSVKIDLNNKSNPWRSPIIWEASLGVILATMSLLSLNFGLFAVSCCLLVGIGIEKLGWENTLVRISTLGCFIVILLQMIFNVFLINQSPGLVPLVFSIHF